MSQLFDLSKKNVLVTGAGGWLGQAYVRALVSERASVFLVDSNPATEEFIRKIKKEYFDANLTFINIDMSQSDQYKLRLESLARNVEIDTVINNAINFGKSNIETGGEGRWDTLSNAQWGTALESGIRWAMDTVEPFLDSLKKRQGSIINVCSMYSFVAPNPKLYEGEWKKYLSQPTYTAVKSGLMGLTKYLSSFLAEDGVRCNAIAPGAFSKPGTDPEFIKRLEKIIPMGRIGRPEDLAGAIVFLTSDSSKYMTGQCLVVDGGWTVR